MDRHVASTRSAANVESMDDLLDSPGTEHQQKPDRQGLIAKLFGTLDGQGTGYIGLSELRRYADLCGFPGNDTAWRSEYEAIALREGFLPNKGMNRIQFADMVNNPCSKGNCETDELIELLQELSLNGSASRNIGHAGIVDPRRSTANEEERFHVVSHPTASNETSMERSSLPHCPSPALRNPAVDVLPAPQRAPAESNQRPRAWADLPQQETLEEPPAIALMQSDCLRSAPQTLDAPVVQCGQAPAVSVDRLLKVPVLHRAPTEDGEGLSVTALFQTPERHTAPMEDRECLSTTAVIPAPVLRRAPTEESGGLRPCEARATSTFAVPGRQAHELPMVRKAPAEGRSDLAVVHSWSPSDCIARNFGPRGASMQAQVCAGQQTSWTDRAQHQQIRATENDIRHADVLPAFGFQSSPPLPQPYRIPASDTDGGNFAVAAAEPLPLQLESWSAAGSAPQAGYGATVQDANHFQPMDSPLRALSERQSSYLARIPTLGQARDFPVSRWGADWLSSEVMGQEESSPRQSMDGLSAASTASRLSPAQAVIMEGHRSIAKRLIFEVASDSATAEPITERCTDGLHGGTPVFAPSMQFPIPRVLLGEPRRVL